MIDKNLGNIERVLRFVTGMFLFGWVVMQPEMSGASWFVSMIGLFLTLNGIFGRCYLWHVLAFSSCGCNHVSQHQFCEKPGV
jgi:hypothetical protein